MKKTINLFILAAAFIAAATPSYSQQTLSGDVKQQIKEVQDAIAKKGAKWTAGETNISSAREDWKYLVGLNFEPVDAEPIGLVAAAELPASIDWRDANGNFVTAPKNQKKCGSCWAFSMTGGLESYTLLKENTPGKDLDLSEQVMLSCSGAGSCNGGRLSAGFLKKTGLPAESAYPYTATDGSCATAAAGWQTGAKKIGAWGSVSQDLNTIKTALVKYGPLPIAFMVYEDFMHYKTGIYSYTTGKQLGGHAVLLVGYNDAEKYFIVKNSWDLGWGENGFFRIAYSEMDNSVNFGLSTIAYRASKDEVPVGEAVRAASFARVSPLLDGVSSWK
ncbi:MAG: C1 family peptidase [Elusimicrobiales bacterium]|nr:C1 family peptidase [Elusimicrobiales bacterium]